MEDYHIPKSCKPCQFAKIDSAEKVLYCEFAEYLRRHFFEEKFHIENEKEIPEGCPLIVVY